MRGTAPYSPVFPLHGSFWRVLLDDEFKAKLKIVKKDDETKKSVLIAGTEFKVYDLDNKKYVEHMMRTML